MGSIPWMKTRINCSICILVRYLQLSCQEGELGLTVILPFPPEIFLYVRTESSQEVIEIHHSVDTSIEKC